MKSAQEPKDSQVDNIHIFSLRAINQQAQNSQSVVVDFSPTNSESKSIETMPRLNQSKDCFEPMFYNPYIKNLLQTRRQVPQTLLQNKSGPSPSPLSYRSSQDKLTSFKPKPSSKYCQLCKQKFDDYLDHINHKVHITHLKENPFQKYIDLFIEGFKRKQKRTQPATSNEKDNTVFSKPKKKIKNYEKVQKYQLKNINLAESTTNSSLVTQHQQKKKDSSTQKE